MAPRDAPERRPRADRPRAVGRAKGGLDDREAAWGEQSRSHSLQRPRADEDRHAPGERAQKRRGHEPHDPDDEDAPAPEPIAERAGEEDERGEGDRVRGDGELELGYPSVELAPDRRQGHVDNGRVELRQARAEHGGEQDPAPGSRPEADTHVGWRGGARRGGAHLAVPSRRSDFGLTETARAPVRHSRRRPREGAFPPRAPRASPGRRCARRLRRPAPRARDGGGRRARR